MRDQVDMPPGTGMLLKKGSSMRECDDMAEIMRWSISVGASGAIVRSSTFAESAMVVFYAMFESLYGQGGSPPMLLRAAP